MHALCHQGFRLINPSHTLLLLRQNDSLFKSYQRLQDNLIVRLLRQSSQQLHKGIGSRCLCYGVMEFPVSPTLLQIESVTHRPARAAARAESAAA